MICTCRTCYRYYLIFKTNSRPLQVELLFNWASFAFQVNLFSTCGEETIASRHHSEIYPATPILRREKSADGILSGSVDNLFAISDFEDPAILALPLELRPRQARVPLSKPGAKIPEPPRLRFDRPFLFFVRHNPTGLILHMGRFNPRLMP